jgi:hypothetical protein
LIQKPLYTTILLHLNSEVLLYTSSERNINREWNHGTMKTPKLPLYLLVVLGLVSVLAAFALATTESFVVYAGKELTRTTPNLAAGDRCTVRLTVTGPTLSTSTIHFFIVLANGTKADYGEVSQRTFDFFADSDGACELHFDNSNATDSQMITINYEIEHFVFGIPNMIFMLIVITVLVVFVAAGYVLMGKYG